MTKLANAAAPSGALGLPSTRHAQDPLDENRLLDTLRPLWRRGSQLHWAVLMDTAFDEGTQPRPPSTDALNCFAGAGALDDLASIAPCLVPLDPDGSCEDTLRFMARHAADRPMLSVLASRIPLSALVMHWHPLHLMQTQDGTQRLLLRWSDARTLAMLAAVLTPAQWHAIAGPLEHWYFIDRAGLPEACPLAPAAPDTGPPDHAPWTLTDEQLGHFMRAAEPDALHAALLSQLEGLGATLPRRSAIHGFTRDALQRADQAAIENMADRFALALSACLTAGGSLMSDRLEPLLRSREWVSGQLWHALLREWILVPDERGSLVTGSAGTHGRNR